jgi:hypothetical protein
MAPAAVPGFVHFPTHHCVTGALRHIYACHGVSLSEELLPGLGAGLGFIYWHQRGAPPVYGGRANLERAGEEGLEKTAGRRTGVGVEPLATGGAHPNPAALLAEATRPLGEIADCEEALWVELASG